MTWATQPGFDPYVLWASFLPDTLDWRIVNVTALAQFWMANPGSNNGILLLSTTTDEDGEVKFHSREAGNGGNAPQLAVRFLP